MSLKYSVIGHYANNRTREVKFYWPGGPINSPEFTQRVHQFLQEFNTVLMGGSKTPSGLPKFDYISVEYSIPKEPRNTSVVSNSMFALTSNAYAYCKSETRPDAVYYWKHEKELAHRKGIVTNCFVMDITKYTNPNVFWKQMRAQADNLFKKACSVPEVSARIY